MFFKYQFKGILLGSVTPMQLGETVIFAYLQTIGFPGQKALSAFLLNKVIHLGLMSLTGIIFLYQINFQHTYLIWIGAVVFLILGLSIIHSNIRIIIRDGFVKRYFLNYYDFFEILSDYARKYQKYLFLNIIANIVKVSVAGVVIWLTFFLFNIQHDFLLLLSVYNLSRMLTLLPVSIGGLGILEGGVALSLSRLGFRYSIVILAMFFLRILSIILALLFLVYDLLQRDRVGHEETKK
jgi:uncharacterized membrane protein YbhN (UPF0104 family)